MDDQEQPEKVIQQLPVDDPATAQRKTRNKIRSLVAYWILGLCNNYGYVVMLTAADDIIGNTASDVSAQITQNSSEIHKIN